MDLENIKIETSCGDWFSNVAKKAQDTATDTQNVEFNFNGIRTIVSKNTNLVLLERDFENASIMDMKGMEL